MVSVRDAKKAQNKIRQQADAYKEACKLVDSIYNNPNAIIDWRRLGKALRVIEGVDSRFAADIKKDLELREAYQIVGGYDQRINSIVEEKRFNKAMQLVEEDDPQFAKAMRELHIQGTSFRDASKEQLATAEQIVRNAQALCTEYSDDSLYNDVVEDKEVAEAFANTPVTGNVSVDEHKRTTFATAQNEVISELAENIEYSQANSKKKRNLLVSRLRTSVKRILFRARRSSVGNDIASIKKALNFKEKVSVSASSIASAYEKAQTKVTAYIKNLYQKGHTKAATFLNKAKTKVHSSMIKLATVSVFLSSLLPSCDSHISRAPKPAEQQRVVVLDDTVKPSVVSDSVSVLNATQQTTVARDTITAPTEWSDSLGVSERIWRINQTFFEDYEKAYKKITDDMLKKSGFQTPDQFLNAYRILRSFYPIYPIENQGDVLLARAETSEKFSKFFNNDDCIPEDQLTADDYKILQIAPLLRGNLNIRSTQETKDSVPCEPGKVQYENVVIQKNEQKEPTFQFVERGQSTIVDDTVPKYTISEKRGSSRVVEKIVTDTVSIDIDVLKGNSLDDGQNIGKIKAEDIIGKKVTEKKGVLVEQTNHSNSKDTKKSAEFSGFVEMGSSNIVDVSAEADSVQVDTAKVFTGFVEMGSSNIVDVSAEADIVQVDTAKVFTGFVEKGSSNIVDESVPAATTIRTDSVQVATTEADSVQIVSDSEDLPFGTPAAGYVEERGGYENRGVGNKKQYLNLRAKIHSTWANELGENAYDVMGDHINSHPEVFRSKGCIGEGWTADQILQSYITMRGAPAGYGNELSILGRLMNPRGCDMHVTAAEIGQINDMLSHSNVDNLRDGVLYEKPTRMTGVTFDQCSKPVSMTVENTSQSNITPHRTSGVKHPEYYMLPERKPVKPEPTYQFDERRGSSRTVVRYVDVETNELSIQKYKGNNMDISESKYLGEIDAKDIIGKKVTNRKNVLVEVTSAEATAQTVDKKAIKEDQKKKLQEQKAAAKANKNAKKKKADKKGTPEVGTLDYWKAKKIQDQQQ